MGNRYTDIDNIVNAEIRAWARDLKSEAKKDGAIIEASKADVTICISLLQDDEFARVSLVKSVRAWLDFADGNGDEYGNELEHAARIFRRLAAEIEVARAKMPKVA